jgi:preprotein translocase subunit SecG
MLGSFFYYFLVLLHLVVSVGLVFFILIQSNKGMGLAGAFGSAGASDSVFGSSGGMNILMKITMVLAIVFTVSSMTLSIIRPPVSDNSLMSRQDISQPQSVKDLIQQGASANTELPGETKEGAAAPDQQ